MVFLLGLYGGGGSHKRMNGRDGAGRRRLSAAARAPRSVRQLYWKLRSRWRRSAAAAAARPRRAGAARFVYDMQSYSRNFDDGLVSGGRRF